MFKDIVDGPTALTYKGNLPIILTLKNGSKNSDQIAEELGLQREEVSYLLYELEKYDIVEKGFQLIEKGGQEKPAKMQQYYKINQDGYIKAQVELRERIDSLT